jgi:O-antigen biosynthesis protein
MISIVTLNWNTTAMTIRLYESLKKYTKDNFCFYVLDNGSEQQQYKQLFDILTQNEFLINITRSEKNLGFAAGNNVICKNIRRFDHGHVFFINSDIIIEEQDWDLKMIEILNQENTGITGCAYHPLIWDANGNFHIQPLSNIPVKSQSVQGAFFGVHKDLFDKLIDNDNFIFDENFKYAQYEETDLCFRIRKKGYNVMWQPIKHVHDHNNSSTKKNGYHLNDEIKNITDFKNNSEKNKKLLVEKHKDIL